MGYYANVHCVEKRGIVNHLKMTTMDEESEIVEEPYYSSSGDEKDKAKVEKQKERKSATRKMHASQNQLATKVEKLNSTMLQ